MLEFLKKYSSNGTYSQNGESGILSECISRLEKANIALNHRAAEIGGSDGHFCSNIALLIDQGWHGTFIEANHDLHLRCVENWKHRPNVKCICAFVDASNINTFVDDSCDLLSIDCDGPDYLTFDALIAKPKIVILEVDSCIPPDRDEFNSAGGAGYLPMLKLAISKGYWLLVHCGNLIVIDNKYRDLFPEIIGDGISNAELYFNGSWIEGGWHRKAGGIEHG